MDPKNIARSLAQFDQASAALQETVVPLLSTTYKNFIANGLPASAALALTETLLASLFAALSPGFDGNEGEF
jgi:hypothetical protein